VEYADLRRPPLPLGSGAEVNYVLTRIAYEKALPFAPLIPNAETVAAMQEARRGKGARFESVSALMADLNADD
jgi:DNA-damage-inducible protein J